MNHSIMTHRQLLLFKWLMVFIPPVTVSVGHSVSRLGEARAQHGPGETLLVHLVTFLALALAYMFVETLFRVLRRLQAEALGREQDILIMNGVVQERARLSRDLHDGAAQMVAHLLLRLDTIKELVETDRRQEAERELERLHEIADEIYEDIGDLITGIRTNVTDHGLIHALQGYADQFEERYHIPVIIRADGAADQFPPLEAFQLFRLVQEALTNVRKHAQAREVEVTLILEEPDQLRVRITDDGLGFTPEDQRCGKGHPLGMTSMRERVEALGGTFQVERQRGAGTQVIATIPMRRARRESSYATFAAPPG